MLIRGYFVNEYLDICGHYWWREGMNAMHVVLFGKHRDGYTDEGVYKLANKYGYTVVEKDVYEKWIADMEAEEVNA